MNNRGQALIEFVIILPILIFILLYIIDFSRIGIKKLELESDMNTIIELYQNKKTDELNNYITSKKIDFKSDTLNNLTTITITKSSKYNMPLLNRILGNKITIKRTIYSE
ncbi:MAG: pilus assembly protein [Bacilli bacterium]|nr:pilus assembly protein [Bacilli bacterium]